MGESQGQGARRGAGVVILLGQRVSRRRALRHSRREAQAREAAGGQPYAIAKAQHRIDHRSGRPGKGAAIERLRVVRGPAAPQEAGAIRLPFHRPAQPALDAGAQRERERQVAALSEEDVEAMLLEKLEGLEDQEAA